MKNDTRSRIHFRHPAKLVHLSLLVCFGAQTVLMPSLAFADVPAVSQQIDTNFPSGAALSQMGYDKDKGVLRVDVRNSGASTVTSNGTTVTGSQGKNVTVTGQYGEKGTMQTQATQTVSSSLLSNGVAAAVIANSAIGSVQTYGEQVRNSLAQGDYIGAALGTAAAVGTSISRTIYRRVTGSRQRKCGFKRLK